MKRLPSHMVGRRILGLTFDGLPIVEPPKAGSSLILGSTGGGKTTCVTVPAVQSLIADHSHALFVNDVKGEVAHQIAAMCVKHGRKFGIVDEFEELGPDYPYRVSLNPFGSITAAFRTSASGLPFVIENNTHALTAEPPDDAKNFYWRESPREFKAFGIAALLDRHPRFCYPGALYALLADPLTLARALETATESEDWLLAAAACQMLDMREHNPEHYSQHLRAALSALKIFASPPLSNAGRTPDLSHADLIREGWVICFVNSVRYADRLGSFFALHFLGLMNEQLQGGAGKAHYILDEFTNAPLRDMLNRVTILRGFGGRALYIAQSRQDIVRRYGEKETAILEENCTIKQYLKISMYEEAERLSKAMGEQLNISRGLGLSSEKQDWSNNYSTGRDPVFTPYELMQLPPEEQILHIVDVGFIHCKKIRQNQIAPYYYDLADNPLEGGRLEPDPLVEIPVATGRAP